MFLKSRKWTVSGVSQTCLRSFKSSATLSPFSVWSEFSHRSWKPGATSSFIPSLHCYSLMARRRVTANQPTKSKASADNDNVFTKASILVYNCCDRYE